MPIITILLLILGIVFLLKGSGIFVSASSKIAKNFGVSDFIIGLTLVALGTSLPELTSSIVASIKQESGLILGTIIGANIANLTLIIGVAAISSKIKIKKDVPKRDGYILAFVMTLLFLFLYDGVISRIEGIIFVLLYFTYILFLMESKTDLKKDYNFSSFIRYFLKFGYIRYIRRGIFLNFVKKKKEKNNKKNNFSLRKYFLLLIFGLILVYFSAEILVKNAIDLANYFAISSIAIGVIISIGTSLPELSVSISASKKKHGNLAVGNSVGSCITNTLLVLGISSIIHPLEIMKSEVISLFPFLAISVFFVLIFIKTDLKITRKEGIFLLLIYLLFLIKSILF